MSTHSLLLWLWGKIKMAKLPELDPTDTPTGKESWPPLPYKHSILCFEIYDLLISGEIPFDSIIWVEAFLSALVCYDLPDPIDDWIWHFLADIAAILYRWWTHIMGLIIQSLKDWWGTFIKLCDGSSSIYLWSLLNGSVRNPGVRPTR